MLEESDKIDLATTTNDGKLMLVITDAGLISDPEERFGLLIAKLRTYVGYVMSEEFTQENAGKTPGDVVIQIMCAQPPTPKMQGLTQINPSGRPDLAIPVQFQIFPRQ